MSNQNSPDLEKELYYLIVKFLENGPCKTSAKCLQTEIEKNKLVIPRKDWLGNDHSQDLRSYNGRNSHVSGDFLLQLCQRLNPIIEKSFPSTVHSLKSLLLRGNLSLLRNDKTKFHSSLTSSRHAACCNNAPKLISLKTKTTSIVPVLHGCSLSGTSKHGEFISHCNIYSKISMQKRILGHLASVYCILFDRTGSIIVTGADDNLLKLWASSNGCLVATLRGHTGQITDIAINKENTLLASGSNDKTIRVWNLLNTHPIAVLEGHTGIITSLQFCPASQLSTRYLVSTGGDGHVCFWTWDYTTTEFNLTPLRFNEKTRPGSQMLCSSFSAGGSFLATGSSDNYIRVYQLYPDGPEKIAELPNHSDHVDSILYSNTGNRFLSGSRDGNAMIWYYKNGDWQAKCLDASMRVQGDSNLTADIESKNKLKVTMICWSLTDHYIITAGTDYLLRVWSSHTAQMLDVLKGHTDEIYVLEIHPTESSILLSGGHDGNVILWDIERLEKIKVFFNMLEGQGHGAIFDCKFSPSGLQFSATDSHGHLVIFGFGDDEPYKAVPFEQFFHTDYRPTIRDANNYVLDEQTQTAPHLMPPPFLVDIDGNPYSSEYQLLIPGRNSSNQPQLRPEQPDVQEELPPLLAEIAAAEAAERNMRSPTRNRQPSFADAAAALLSPGGVGGLGLRESGDVEGVRQQNDLYVSGDITDADADAWRNRTIIYPNNLYNQVARDEKRRRLGIEEINIYNKEKLKGELLKKSTEISENENRSTKHFLQSVTRGRGRGRGRTRQARVRQHVSYVRGSAMQSHNVSQPSGNEVINIDGDVDSTESEPEDWQGESSESDDSDWVEERKVVKEMVKNSRGRRKNRRVSSEINVDDDEHVDVVGQNSSDSSSETSVSGDEKESSNLPHDNSSNDDNSNAESVASNSKQKTGGKRRGKQRVRNASPVARNGLHKKIKKEIKSKKPIPSLNNVEEYLKYYQPPDWLLSCECQKFPYVPQINDEVYYLRQGHMLYVQEVIKWNEYDIQEGRQVYRRYDLAPAELCKLVGISYDVGPPKMCSLKLELIGKRKSTGGKKTITTRFHDMPHVVDFLVLRHLYEQSLKTEWKPDDRFRCIIDDSWYFGTVVEVSPLHEEFPTSSFLSLLVKWDSGDDERLSPWDLEPIPPDEDIDDSQDNILITTEDKLIYKYPTTEADWPFETAYDFAERVCKGLEDFSALEIASPFAFPVEVHQYPTYWSHIAFPTDLETIRKRIKNQFYRRLDSVLWELRQLKSNATKFNEPGTTIVIDATFVVKVLSRFMKEPQIKDVIGLYSEMKEAEETKVNRPRYIDRDSDSEDEINDKEHSGGKGEESNEVAQEEEGLVDAQLASGLDLPAQSSQDWVAEAINLLEFISAKDDAQPFRQPVDVELFQDYPFIITEPMDISTIRHRLEDNQYANADAYIKDFQQIFKNSKTYNTDRRSAIYKMTLRLSTLFEARCQEVRNAFAVSEERTHWTRTRTRNHQYRMDSMNSIESRNKGVLDLRSVVKNEHSNPSRKLKNEPEPCTSRTQRSPVKRKKLILDQFIQRPKTRASHTETKTSPMLSRSSRNSKTKLVHKSSEPSESETYSQSEEDTPSKPIRESSVKTRTRFGRLVSTKRKRYGFESDEEELPKKCKQNKVVERSKSKTSKRETGKSRSGNTSIRSSRKRTNVNYCEDDMDDFDGFEEERESEEEIEEEIEDSEELSDNEDSSSSNEENSVPAPLMSSRGRLRRVASRFNDFVD